MNPEAVREEEWKGKAVHLPIELLILLFEHVRQVEDHMKRDQRGCFSTLAWVCRQWREIAVSMKHVWCENLCTLPDTDAFITFLEWSGSRGGLVFVNRRLTDFESLQLIRNNTRVTTIAGVTSETGHYPPLLFASLCHDPWPILVKLHIVQSFPSFPGEGTLNMPLLEELDIKNCYVPFVAPRLSSLSVVDTALHVPIQMEPLLAQLELLPSFTFLRLIRVFTEDSTKAVGPAVSFRLISLQVLILHCSKSAFLKSWNVHIPATASVELTVDMKGLGWSMDDDGLEAILDRMDKQLAKPFQALQVTRALCRPGPVDDLHVCLTAVDDFAVSPFFCLYLLEYRPAVWPYTGWILQELTRRIPTLDIRIFDVASLPPLERPALRTALEPLRSVKMARLDMQQLSALSMQYDHSQSCLPVLKALVLTNQFHSPWRARFGWVQHTLHEHDQYWQPLHALLQERRHLIWSTPDTAVDHNECFKQSLEDTFAVVKSDGRRRVPTYREAEDWAEIDSRRDLARQSERNSP